MSGLEQGTFSFPKAKNLPWQQATRNLSEQFRSTDNLSLAVDLTNPALVELARLGKIFSANTGAGTAKAPDTALPTTTAVWALWNGNATGSTPCTCLVILQIASHAVSGTLGLGMGLVAGMSTVTQVATTAYSSAVQATSTMGASTTASKAIFSNNVTLAGAPCWIPLAGRDTPAAVEVGAVLASGPLNGLFVVPPGYALGASVVAPVGTSALFGMTFTWAEIPLTLNS